jgi:hypothetical protein
MTVRDYTDVDKQAVAQLHRDMGMDYLLPDLDSPLFIVRKVYVNDSGRVIGTEFLKLQAEAYLMLDCTLDTVEKTRVIAHLSHAVEREAYNRGIDTLAAYIPEDISNKFTKRLNLLGWDKARKGWITWFRELI